MSAVIDVNAYLAKRYSAQPCWELVADIYQSAMGAIPVDYRTVNRSIRQMADAFRVALYKSPHGFEQVEEPRDFTVVLMGKNQHIGIHHCGIWYQGKVLHAQTDLTLYEELSAVRERYAVIEFWDKA